MSVIKINNPELQEKILDVITPPKDATHVLETVQTPDGKVELHEKTPEQLVSETDPGAAAGALFALYGSKFFNIVDGLSNKQLRRLVKALVTYPLEDVFVNTKVPIEMNAYHIGNEMITSRFLATLAHVYEEEEKRKVLTAQQKAANISPEAEKVLSESIENLKEGKAGDPIELMAKEFLEDNKQLMQNLAKQEEIEKGEKNG